MPDTINISYGAEWYAPLRISAYEDEKVTLSGGAEIPLSAMETADSSFTDNIVDKPEAGKVLQYSLAEAGITDYGEISLRGFLISDNAEAQMELSLDGEMQKLACWPNDGHVGLIQPREYGEAYGTRNKDGIANGCSFKVDYDRPSKWNKQHEVWLSGTLGPNYNYEYYPMERFDSSDNRVYLSKGAVQEYYGDSQHYKFENIPEELDSEGEYYIDREAGMLYYYPPETASENSVLTLTMPTQNLSGSGNDLIRLENCQNITFENLTFKGGRGSGITGKNNSGIKLLNCDINSFGMHGIRFDESKKIEVRGCKIHDVGQDGMQFTRCGDYQKLIPNYIIICNNDIYNFARLERSYKTGINIGFQSVGATAARNHIHNGPHAGMIFYGPNHNIYGNEFDNLVTEFSDMDALYSNVSCYPWERGNNIHGNYFHDIGRSTLAGKHQINVRAIRSDNKGCGLNVYGNLFYKIGDIGAGNGNNNVGAVTVEGTRNRIINNLFVDCNETYINTNSYNASASYKDESVINGVTVSKLRTQMAGYIDVYGKQFPELYSFFDEHPNRDKTNEFRDNIVVNITTPLSKINDNIRFSDQGFWGYTELTEASGNYVGSDDIGFKSYENENFELSEAGRSFVSSFPNIMMSSFGIMN